MEGSARHSYWLRRFGSVARSDLEETVEAIRIYHRVTPNQSRLLTAIMAGEGYASVADSARAIGYEEYNYLVRQILRTQTGRLRAAGYPVLALVGQDQRVGPSRVLGYAFPWADVVAVPRANLERFVESIERFNLWPALTAAERERLMSHEALTSA